MAMIVTWCPFPLAAMGIASTACVLARVFLGRTKHPVEKQAEDARTGRDADDVEQLDSFAILTLSGHFLAQAAIFMSLCVLPVAFNWREALHCLAVLAIVQGEMVSTKLLAALVARRQAADSPFAAVAQEPWETFWLWSNLADWYRQHGCLHTAYYTLMVLWYETFVNMLLAGPLQSCGWGFAPACLLVGLVVGLVNHGAVNGPANGAMATPFYVTMAAIYTVSHSVLPVTVAHAVFYFRQQFATATSPGFGEPLFLAILLVNTLGMYALLGALSFVLPPALPLNAPQSSAAFATSWSSAFALASFALDGVRLTVMSARYLRAGRGSTAPDATPTQAAGGQPPEGLAEPLIKAQGTSAENGRNGQDVVVQTV